MATLIKFLLVITCFPSLAHNNGPSLGGSVRSRVGQNPSSCTWYPTGKYAVKRIPISSPFIVPSDSDQYLAIKQDKKLSMQKKVGTQMQNLWTLEFTGKVANVKYSADEKTALVTTEKNDRYWIDTNTGQTRHSTDEKTRDETSLAIHPQFHLELFQKRNAQFFVRDYATKSEIPIPLDIKNFITAAFSADSKKLAFHLTDKVLIYDFATQQTETISVSSNRIGLFWTEKGELLAETEDTEKRERVLEKIYPGGRFKWLNIPKGTLDRTFKSKKSGIQFSLESQGSDYKVTYNPSWICVNSNQHFSIDPASTKKPNIQSLCGQPFSAQAWNAALGQKPPAQLSADEAQAWLNRMAKPGGLGTDVHLNLFLQLLPQAKTRWPNLVASVLQNIATLSPLLYDTILEQSPDLKNLKSPALNPCLTTQEKTQVGQGALSYAHHKALFNPTTKSDF